FGHTRAAVLTRLVAEVALGGWEPAAVAALLAHPLARLGRPPDEARRLARVVELVVLRGPRTRPFGRGLLAAYDERVAMLAAPRARAPRPVGRLDDATLGAARDLLAALVAALEPLESLAATGDVAVPSLLAAHVAALTAVARDDGGSDAALYDGDDGAALAAALAEFGRAAASEGAVLAFPATAWPGFFDALVGDAPVRRPTAPDARIFVFGPLEARLLSFDLLVLAGLDEGVWPITTRTDPWLSRPMRRDMALEAPERRIGLSAHDYAQGAAAPRVILARAARAGGAPTVPSRWLQRLTTLIGPKGRARLTGEASRFLAWARGLDAAGAPPRTVARPAPKPPLAWRPTKLSVTEIETWIRDPYAVHARHVLGLDPLDPPGGEIGAAERGTFVHEVLAEFVRDWSGAGGPAEAVRLAEIAERRLDAFDAFPEVVALWRPRLEAIARWWLAADAARSPVVGERRTEVGGRWELPVDGVPFTLTGVADRLDILKDGSLAVLDYKTGRPPSEKEVQSLLAPQLPLEAAMADAGAFGPDVAGRPLAELAYLHLKGGEEGGRWERRGTTAGGRDAAGLAEEARLRLIDLVRRFRDPETGYASRLRVRFEKDRSGPYDHLARVAEWAAGEIPEGGES
ncbi:MAG: double-strand break repair protein AddB, partial [Siculibacillus sp.]|nr:double-strand break repair protein AddB [Siculibacillus sp.]